MAENRTWWVQPTIPVCDGHIMARPESLQASGYPWF